MQWLVAVTPLLDLSVFLLPERQARKTMAASSLSSVMKEESIAFID